VFWLRIFVALVSYVYGVAVRLVGPTQDREASKGRTSRLRYPLF